MVITLEQVREILGRGFDEGYDGCYDMRSAIIDRVLEEFQVSTADTPRVYTVGEMNLLPIGTTFFHPILGKGWILDRHPEHGKRYMQFEKNNKQAHFNSDQFPWSEKMRLLPGVITQPSPFQPLPPRAKAL